MSGADKSRGYYQKYIVERVDGKPVTWTFVLEEHDPFAIPALKAYAEACEKAGYLELAGDLLLKIDELESK